MLAFKIIFTTIFFIVFTLNFLISQEPLTSEVQQSQDIKIESLVKDSQKILLQSIEILKIMAQSEQSLIEISKEIALLEKRLQNLEEYCQKLANEHSQQNLKDIQQEIIQLHSSLETLINRDAQLFASYQNDKSYFNNILSSLDQRLQILEKLLNKNEAMEESDNILSQKLQNLENTFNQRLEEIDRKHSELLEKAISQHLQNLEKSLNQRLQILEQKIQFTDESLSQQSQVLANQVQTSEQSLKHRQQILEQSLPQRFQNIEQTLNRIQSLEQILSQRFENAEKALDRRMKLLEEQQNSPLPKDMIYILPGIAKLGSKEDPDFPYQEIEMFGFYIDKYEVTKKQFIEFAKKYYKEDMYWSEEGLAWRKLQPERFWNLIKSEEEDLPITQVSYYEAEAYAKCVGKRLPTAQEWEYAARGSDVRKFPWGNEIGKSMANYRQNNLSKLAPVSQFIYDCSPFEVIGLAGNVAEWTQTSIPSTDSKLLYQIKGGSFQQLSFRLLSYTNFYSEPNKAFDFVGFRCVKDIEKK